jgi:hypothetical protein
MELATQPDTVDDDSFQVSVELTEIKIPCEYKKYIHYCNLNQILNTAAVFWDVVHYRSCKN